MYLTMYAIQPINPRVAQTQLARSESRSKRFRADFPSRILDSIRTIPSLTIDDPIDRIFDRSFLLLLSDSSSPIAINPFSPVIFSLVISRGHRGLIDPVPLERSSSRLILETRDSKHRWAETRASAWDGRDYDPDARPGASFNRRPAKIDPPGVHPINGTR